jgi:ATP/maltotriose-dependent transcriptional regulator MalT/DNA-binding SARP family transcriptional activator
MAGPREPRSAGSTGHPLSALNPLFSGKTRAPVLPRPYLARPRLLAALRQSSRRRVTVITAPAGAGKTTLLADFARGVHQSCAWYSIDDLDDSPIAFLHGIALAVGCRSTRSLDALGYLAQIVERLRTPAAPRTLIIDDIHRLSPPPAARALSDLVRYLPPPTRLILAGRGIPAEINNLLDWLAAQCQLACLSWDDLQLTEEERIQAAAVFKTRTSGAWILSWARPDGLDLERYLDAEVLTPLGSRVIKCLARLSVLPSFDPSLAAGVTGLSLSRAAGLLTRIGRETPLFEQLGGKMYRFTETARAILQAKLSPRERAAARRAAGAALRGVDPCRSAECYLEANDRGEAARSLALIPLTNWLTQSPSAVHDLLDRLETNDLRTYPRLRLARAWALVAWKGQTREALDLLNSTDSSTLEPEIAFWHLYVQARANLAIGQGAAAVTAYRAMCEIIDRLRRSPSAAPAATAGILCRVAMIEWLLGDHQQATETARQGLAVAELSPDSTRVERLLLHQVLGAFTYWDGDYEAADEHFQAALSLADDPADVAMRASILHSQAGVARCRGEFIRALGCLEQALREPLVPTREQTTLNLQAAHALADVEDFRAAARRYRAVIGTVHEGDRDGCFSRALAGLAISCLALGLTAEADMALEQLRQVQNEPARYDRLLAEGMRALHAGNPRAAREYFAAARQVTGTPGGFQDAWQAVLLEAYALQENGDSDLAERTIVEFIEKRPGRALPAVGLWVLRPIAPLLTRIAARYPDSSLTALLRLTAADRSAPKLLHAVAAIDRPPAPGPRQTEVRLFGPPRLIIDGQEVQWPYGLRHKAIELFWYAVLHLDGFTRDQAMADIFPDRDPTTALKHLQVTVSNLRTALAHLLGAPGDRLLARQADGSFRLCLEATPGEITIETRLLASFAEELRMNRRMRLPAVVPSLFRGELLAGFNAEWIEPIRRYWMSLYLRTLSTLADRYTRQGLLQQAIRCYELVLQVDPTLESAHAELMRLYHAAGDRQAVESQMWLYTRIARDELDAEPDADVEELYRQLTADRQERPRSWGNEQHDSRRVVNPS